MAEWFIVKPKPAGSGVHFSEWADKIPRGRSLLTEKPPPCPICGAPDGSCKGERHGN